MTLPAPREALEASCSDGLAFDEATHTYTRDGHVLVPVTRIVRAAIPDVRNVRRFWTARHRRVGQVAHACTALDDRGLLDERTVAPAVQGRLAAWRGFRRRFPQFVPHLVEQRLWSAAGVAGTADRIGTWEGKLCVLDLKGMVDVPYTRLQTAGYAVMFAERTGLHVRVRIAVGLADDGTHDFHLWDEPRQWIEDRAAWAHAVGMYSFWARHGLLLPDEEDGR